jgi:hypothetical protein
MAMSYGWMVESLRAKFQAGAKVFHFVHNVETGSEAYPASYPMGTSSSFQVVRQPWREADHSPTSSAEVKNCGAISPFPHSSRRETKATSRLLYLLIYIILRYVSSVKRFACQYAWIPIWLNLQDPVKNEY